MKFSVPFICSAVVLAAATPATPAPKENIAPREVSATKPGELHPANFPNIQAAQEFHKLIKELYPLVDNAASLAGIKMKDLLDGTPFDWDAEFASGSIQRRGYFSAVPLMAEASKILLGFISRAADYSHHDIISSLAETIRDFIA